MRRKQRDGSKHELAAQDVPVPMAAQLAVLLTVHYAVFAAYIFAFLTGASALVWIATVCQAGVWVFHWAEWMLARRNLAGMPLFGKGVIPPLDARHLPGVTLIAPARNEAVGVEAAVRSMAAMEYADLELILVDDHSTDATPQILDRLAGEFPRLRVLHDPPRPPGWMGKQNAVWHAVQHAAPSSRWLLFTDADIVFGPTVLRDAISYVEQQQVDFLTCLPHIETSSVFEELVLALGWHRFLLTPRNQEMQRPGTRATGVGAFMLARREVYMALGGHTKIADCPSEDTALGELFSHVRTRLGWMDDQLRCRQYHGLDDALKSLTLKQRRMAKGKLANILLAVNHQLLLNVLPLLLAAAGLVYQIAHHHFSASFTAFSIMALLGYVQGVLTYRVSSAISRNHPMAPYLYPIGGLLRLWVSVRAIVDDIRRAPLHWRGRPVTDDPKPASSETSGV